MFMWSNISIFLNYGIVLLPKNPGTNPRTQKWSVLGGGGFPFCMAQ